MKFCTYYFHCAGKLRTIYVPMFIKRWINRWCDMK